MKIILSFVVLITTLNMAAQNSWKVYLGKKELLSSKESADSGNIIHLTDADLKSQNDLVITFFEEEPQEDWSRVMSVTGNNDTELTRKEKARILRIIMIDLKKFLQEKFPGKNLYLVIAR
ncbi:MAG: hypothetical protein HC867_08820 [Bacteroidia bacterium]|nr:hypothetical protein [Bacteroidia bacterium]